MKKGILFALAALCVSAVQAVTITWSANTTTGGTAGESNNWLGVLLISGEFDPSKNGSYTAWNDGTSQAKMTATPEGVEVHYNAGSNIFPITGNAISAQTFDAGDLAAGTYTLLFYSPGWYNSNKNFQYYTFNLTDAMVEGGAEVTIDSIQYGNPGQNKALTGTASVPEPTALALLALGVAGLALRRKA